LEQLRLAERQPVWYRGVSFQLAIFPGKASRKLAPRRSLASLPEMAGILEVEHVAARRIDANGTTQSIVPASENASQRDARWQNQVSYGNQMPTASGLEWGTRMPSAWAQVPG
jgi:hypothetical protein